jgi:hypothetical protein
MQVCFSCQTMLPERGSHCRSCGVQARCKSCREPLEAGDQFCGECGTPVGQTGLTPDGHTNGKTANFVFNEIEIEGRNNRLRAKVSNEAVAHLSNPISLYIEAYTGITTRRGRTSPSTDTLDVQPELPGMESPSNSQGTQEDIIEGVTPKELPPFKTGDVETERLKELFRERDGQLCLEEPQLKATNKLDYAQRLAYLYLYYQEKVADKESVPRSALDAILNENTEVDWRVPAWIKSEAALVKRGDNIYLNSEGRRAARTRLQEAFDESREAGWLPGETTCINSPKVGAGEKGGQAAKGSKNKAERNSKVKREWVSKWKARKIDIDGYALFSKRSRGEKGMFGLWAIRQALGETDGKIVSRRHLADFLYHAFDIEVDESSLYTALKAKDMKDYVLNVGGTKFQILPPGMKEIEKIVTGNKGASKKH